MSVSLSLFAGAGQQFFTDNGVPLAGGLVYTYAAGTTTPQATYTASTGSVANSNPIVLDSAGRVPYEIWLTNNVSYKFIVKDSTFVQIGSYDNLTGQGTVLSDLYVGGNVTISGNLTVTGSTIQNRPSFSAYLVANQSVTTNTATKVTINTEEWDTNTNFDTTTYRFQPTIAGYYQINGCVYLTGTTNTQGNAYVYIYKNGSAYKQGDSITTTAADGTGLTFVISTIVYFNGTSDYIELYASNQQTNPVFGGGQALTYFNGAYLSA